MTTLAAGWDEKQKRKERLKKISTKWESDKYCGLLYISHGEFPFLHCVLQYSVQEPPCSNYTKGHERVNQGLRLN